MYRWEDYYTDIKKMRQIHIHRSRAVSGLIADRCRGSSDFSFMIPLCYGSLWLTLEKKQGKCLLGRGWGELSTKEVGLPLSFIVF